MPITQSSSTKVESRLEEMEQLKKKKRKSVQELSIQMDLIKSIVNYKEKPEKRPPPQLYDKKQNNKNENMSPKVSSPSLPRPKSSVAFFLPIQEESDSEDEEDHVVKAVTTPTSARSNNRITYPDTVPLYERRIHSARSSRASKFANFC